MAFAAPFEGTIEDLEGQELPIQAVVSVKCAVNLQDGINRRAAISRQGADKARVIGDVQIQDHDPRLDIFKGDLLVQVVSQDEFAPDVGPFFDSRGTVFSSFAGYLVPDHVRTESQWCDHTRFVGVAAFDVLYSMPDDQIQYGITAWGSGSIGGPKHRAPEPFFTGDLLQMQLPPLDSAKRDQWAKALFYDTEHARPGTMKPVLRRWNAFDALDGMRAAITEFYSGTSGTAGFLQLRFEHLEPEFGSNNALGTPVFVNDEQEFALQQSRATVAAAFFGAMVLEEFGLVKFNTDLGDGVRDRWREAIAELLKRRTATTTAHLLEEHRINVDAAAAATVTTASLSNAEKDARKRARLFVARELGLLKRDNREQPFSALTARLVSTVNHALFNDTNVRVHSDAATFFPTRDQDAVHALRRVQESSTMGIIRAIVDRYHRHGSSIVAKSIRNSRQGGPMDIQICT